MEEVETEDKEMDSERIYGIEDFETEYLKFRYAGRYPKTEYWCVLSRKDSKILGAIKWYGSWRQYIFIPEYDTLFNVQCLVEISEILKRLNEAHMRLSKIKQGVKGEL